ncbi:MAG TPA: lipid A deacylase LpxR family protein [Gemmatimonadaceae bacterium]|nr:lipid A deacylase LpxR family protein [Gemmatimonadaceae bacterium]
MAVPIGAAISQSAPLSPASATERHSLTLRIDNDAFDFWMLPWNRPDDEYTSGVHIDYDGGDAPIWARAFLGGRESCVVGARSCRSARMELGQDIYTPSVSVDSAHAAPGSRPNAGWLFLSQTARALDEHRSDEFTLTAGVTGAPSLARYMQALAHRAGPAFNRPTDWSRQLGFEPGIVARVEERRRVSLIESDAFGADILPRVAASVGNVITNAELGLDTRVGVHLPHPWLVEANRFALTLSAGASGQAVARNLFLDGNTFKRSVHVGHEPFVLSGNAGIELRYEEFTLGYRAQSDSRAYALGPKWHPWATLVGGVSVDR